MRVLHAEPNRVRSFTALVVDHEAPSRTAMGALLRRLGATDVVAVKDLVQARVAALGGGPRDLCVLNLDLPGGCLNLLADLRNAGWPRLLAVSGKSDAFSLRAAFVAGAHAYVLTADAAAAMPRVPSPRLPLRSPPVTATPAPLMPVERVWRQLSAREIEVLQLVAAGQSNSAAGVHLQLSALTVKSHLARIARKLGTGDRAHMVAVAMRTGLIS
ncbi:MAG: DNA-binding response regulator [Pseudonocardiales bacterium]|nr:MAG: DNA-binding response regulator [Pseudonocardiales bacterium]